MTSNTPRPSSSASKKAQRTFMGGRFLGALTRGPYRKSSGSHSPSSLKNKGLAFPFLALLAALAVGMLVLLPVGPLQAQQSGMIDYAENGTGAVATFTAVDPEEASPVLWSLLSVPPTPPPEVDGTDLVDADFADNGAFEISDDGVLTFDEAPDFENPPSTDGTANEYKVVVQASDGTEMNWFRVTVNVTDEEEEGSVKLRPTAQAAATLLQPQVLVPITAHGLTDGDGTSSARTVDMITTGAEYQWYRTSSKTAMGTALDRPLDTTAAVWTAYTPQATSGNSDVGSYLRVVATYTDGRGRNKTATAVSEYPTIGRISNNTPPKFPAESTTRAVIEEMPKGTAIGNPVTATDKDSGEMLTYWLGGTGNDAVDNGKFAIDAGTGQLMVNVKLNYESGTEDQCDAVNECKVTVMVADSSGADPTAETPTGTDSITVTITVTGVDEKPGSFTGATMIVREEGTTVLMSNGAVTYAANDPEGGVVTLTLSGDDGDKFKLTGDDADELEFKEKPDFENPGDMNRDNVYEVTVVASDGANSAMRDVTVKVTNMEEAGEIEVMPAQPRVGTELTADLTDSDGIVSGPTWQWYKRMVANVADACSGIDPMDWEPVADPDMHEIEDAMAEAYTPVSKDDGYCLRVKADYVDGFYDTDADPDMMFDKSMASVLSGKVQGSSVNMAPEFEEGTRAMRYVPENSQSIDVGKAVVAKDDPMPTYQIGGRDAGSFEIDLATGQITVKANAKLDHENKPTHTVTVTATDSHNDTDTITVTIHVTDADEPPAAMMYTYDVDDYTENDDVEVVDLDAVDPEEASPVLWSLLSVLPIPTLEVDGTDLVDADFADNGAFEISDDGVLTFDEAPDFENPPSTDGTANEYKVVVQASDGTEMNWFRVTVNVTDEEEEGSVKLRPTAQAAATLLQPQVLVPITAHGLTDGDGTSSARTVDMITTGAEYQWYRTSSKTAMGTALDRPLDTTAAVWTAYTPQATAGNSDVGSYLRVVATYTDGRGSNKTATAVSEYRTIAQNPSNTAPAFPAESTARAVAEEMPKGTAIGNPVTATDKDSGEMLTYWLAGADASKFAIDARTGQLMVNVKLNYESGADDQCADDNACVVTVMVADSSGTTSTDETPAGTDSTDVTITVTGVDEKPGDFMGATMIMREEGTTVLMSNSVVVTYAAKDPEGGVVTLTLSGDDGDKFKLTGDDADELEFKEKPDFENPGDMNRDNVYEVTVVASDGANSAMRDVTVKVTNMEEAGEIEVMPAQPRVGTELTADLTDSDGIVSGPTWQWYKRMVANVADACSGIDPMDWEPVADPDMHEIEDALAEAYTPVSKDDGYCLRVKADYVDGFYDTDMMFDKSMASVLSGKVQGSSVNMAPEFEEGTRAMRYVPEDAMDADNVGQPVVAKDPGDTLGYMLGGPDAGSFDIGDTDDTKGQIMVGAAAELDHESKPTHTVTVTATDPHGVTDMITVTIHVTDVDEKPEIMKADPGQGLTISGRPSKSYAENGTGSVAAYTATGAVGSVTWTLGGDDMDDFNISTGGRLTFMDPPDYEMPMDMGTNNVYMVTVKAEAGGEMDMMDVTVTVTNVEEMGEVTLWAGTVALTVPPQVGDTITGAVMDPDGGETGETWQWARSTDMSSWMDIQDATDAPYMVAADDTGYYLRVMATYMDAAGTDMAMEYSPATMMVGAMAAEMTLLERYDANDNDEIDLDEVFKAIDDYFDFSDRLTLAEIYELVDLYFES